MNQDTIDITHEPDATCHLDMLGGGTEEETKLWLKYYADDAERLWWSDTLGSGAANDLPEKENPAFNRDRLLPKAEEY